MNNEIFLTDKQLAQRYGISSSTLWRWKRSDPTFPPSIKFSKGTTRFKLTDVLEWETLCEAASSSNLSK